MPYAAECGGLLEPGRGHPGGAGGPPLSAATKRWSTAPMASAATAVRSACPPTSVDCDRPPASASTSASNEPIAFWKTSRSTS